MPTSRESIRASKSLVNGERMISASSKVAGGRAEADSCASKFPIDATNSLVMSDGSAIVILGRSGTADD